MRTEPTKAEKLVREKDKLVKEERELDMWLVNMRLGDTVTTEKKLPELKRMFFRKTTRDSYEHTPVDPTVANEFYLFVAEKRSERLSRIREIDTILNASNIGDER